MDHILNRLVSLVDEKPIGSLADWACRVCKESREAHKRVWLASLPEDDVLRLIRVLSSLAEAMGGHGECDLYQRNLRIRLSSMNNYLAGGMPVLPPDAPEDEAAIAKHVEWARKNRSECSKLLSSPAFQS